MKKNICESFQIHSIQKIMASYCRFIDTKNWIELKGLFSQNSRMSFRDEMGKLLYEFDSPEQLVSSAQNAIGNAVTLHHLHNPEITLLNDSEAHAIWAMEDRFYISGNEPHPYFHGAGYYHMRFTFHEDRWQISEMQLSRLRLQL